MITWLKINFGQWPDHVDRPNKFLRCHVSMFLTGQNKEKKLTLDSLQAQNYQLLGLVWQFVSICHLDLPNQGKRKVAAHKLKLGK